MDIETLKKEFHEYAERTVRIKQLSFPDLKKLDNADAYSKRLQQNFSEIGRLAAINRDMLDTELFPILKSDDNLDEELAEELENLAERLLNMASTEDDFENLDLPIMSLITDRIAKDSEKKGDIASLIRSDYEEISAVYSLMVVTARLTEFKNISEIYVKRGLALGDRSLELIEKDNLISIPDMESRGIALSNARFIPAFYERSVDPEENRRSLEIFDKMIEIYYDDFYREAIEDYDWDYFIFRTLEHYISSTDICNMRGFNKDQLDRICEVADLLDEILTRDSERYSHFPVYRFVPVSISRCRYLSGRLTIEEYKKILLDYYETRNKYDYGADEGYFQVLIPLEYICLIDPDAIDASDTRVIKKFYLELIGYALSISNYGAISYVLEYYLSIVSKYIEIPSGISLEDFILRFMAAIHPPTYVHSMMVGQITERLCHHLLRYSPELFIGMPGCESVEDVLTRRAEILSYAYHSATLHDSGKIYIIDTIFIYGRKLLDLEFELIKSHPVMGHKLLSEHELTRKYADVALFHHKWYDDSRGYPADKKSTDSAYKTIIDLVQCADCLDAATDSVGRSYNKGKTLDEFMTELRDGSGTRYAPWLIDLFDHEDVYNDIIFLLDEGRMSNYRDTFTLLRDVQEKRDNI